MHRAEGDYQRITATERKEKQVASDHPRSAKQKELGSDLHHDEFYTASQTKAKGERQVMDFDLSGLPEHITNDELKRMVGARHFIEASTEADNIKNTCTGKGRIKFRVTDNDNVETIRLKLAKEGIAIKEHNPDLRKKSNYGQLAQVGWADTHAEAEERRMPRDKDVDPKAQRVRQMQSNADVFGNTNDHHHIAHEARFGEARKEMINQKGETTGQSLTLSNWDEVRKGGQREADRFRASAV